MCVVCVRVCVLCVCVCACACACLCVCVCVLCVCVVCVYDYLTFSVFLLYISLPPPGGHSYGVVELVTGAILVCYLYWLRGKMAEIRIRIRNSQARSLLRICLIL